MARRRKNNGGGGRNIGRRVVAASTAPASAVADIDINVDILNVLATIAMTNVDASDATATTVANAIINTFYTSRHDAWRRSKPPCK